MSSLRDIFGSSFLNDYGNGDNNNMPNTGSNQQNRETGVATNLTETNNGIARQSDLVDEVMALKQQQLYPQSHHRNFLNAITNNNKQESAQTDEILMDLTRNVNKLTMTERQEAQNEVYGLGAKNRTEDPWELNMWMNDMDDVIKREISGNDKRFSALRLTMHTQGDNNNGLGSSMSGIEYVRSQKLKFLRASDWVVEDAVTRMALFFELKLEYFGSSSLIRDLTMKDLTQEDIDLWKQYGFLQLSQDQDTNGRAILVMVTRQQLHLPHATVIRCLLYLSSVMARDESIQRCGSVQLFWGLGHQFTVNARATAVIQAYGCIPIRAVARHFCKDSKGVQDMFGLIAKTIKAFEAIRFKGHSGTAMECCYNLMTYGIPRTAIPIDNEGEVELSFHINFLKTMERKEADEETRQRQERLDKQIQMVLNNSMHTISSGRQMSDGRGEPYQREPPMLFDEGAQGSDRSSLLSWSMAGMSSMDPFSIRTHEMDGLPEDFMKQIASTRSDVTMASANHGVHEYSPSRIRPIEPSMITSAPMPSPMANDAQSQRKKDDLILVPAMYDVIMGRGRHNKKKPGNRKLNDLLEAYQEEYERSDKFQKTVLSEFVVAKMIEGGSRFLVREGDKTHGMWVEVSLEKARDKVAHDFRNLRRSAKAAQNTNSAAAEVPPAGGLPNMPSTKDGSVKRQRSMGNTSEGQGSIKRVGKFD